MTAFHQFVYWEGILFFGVLGAILFTQLLSGDINTRGLLYGRKNSQLYFSPGRVQLLVLTLGGAFNYLMSALQAPTPHSLPPVPAEWIAILGGSNGVYLLGKAYATFLPK